LYLKIYWCETLYLLILYGLKTLHLLILHERYRLQAAATVNPLIILHSLYIIIL